MNTQVLNCPLCFIVMPFGKKKDADGGEVDFDLVYRELIRPAVEAADMQAVRADEETVNGIIHKPMYERLILCDYAVADLTTANANVFYELGIRHAVKPCTTITVFSSTSKLPFDLHFLRCLPYNWNGSSLADVDRNRAALTEQLMRAKKQKTTDSPVYQLVDGIAFQNSVAHEKTDIFRDKVKYNTEIKNRLAAARRMGNREDSIRAVDAIAGSLQPDNEETGVLIDVMLSYRALSDYGKMIAFIETMPLHVRQTVMVQEQLAFACNRTGAHEAAIAVLEKVLQENGPSSETYGILGRVYKDLFEKAGEEGNEFRAEAWLDKAVESYRLGFEADWRDAYPGVNAVTLLALKNEQEVLRELIPVVCYAVKRKLERKKPEYWDYATLMELAVIENNDKGAVEFFKKALSCPVESWMFDTTINNLELLQQYRQRNGGEAELNRKIIGYLKAQQQAMMA